MRWKPGKIISYGFEKMIDRTIAYSIEYFDAKRNHSKVFYVLNPKSTIVKKIGKDETFVQTGRLKRRFPLKKIKNQAIETRHGAVTHWPTVDEIKLLFTKAGFKKIDILGDGLLMGLILEGNRKVTKTIKKEPELFFEIERKLVRFVDPRKTYTVIVKATAP